MSKGFVAAFGSLAVTLATAALLALPAGVAQAPVPFEVALSSDLTSTDFAPGDCVTFAATVTNTGQSPVPPAHQITLTLTTAPAGWTVTAPNPSTVTLAPAATADVTFELCAEAERQDGDTATVTLTATVQSDPRNPRPFDDLVFRGTVVDDSLLGLDLPSSVLWIALASIAGLIAVVLLTRRKASAGIVVSCPEPSKEVLPGRGTSFPVRVRNDARGKDVVSLTTSPVPRGWDTFLPLVDVPLEPREEQTIWLSVKSPADSTPGDRVVVKVVARSALGGAEQAAIDTLTTVRGPTSPEAAAAPPPAPAARARDEEPLDEEASVYGPEDEAPTGRPVAVKRRKG